MRNFILVLIGLASVVFSQKLLMQAVKAESNMRLMGLSTPEHTQLVVWSHVAILAVSMIVTLYFIYLYFKDKE